MVLATIIAIAGSDKHIRCCKFFHMVYFIFLVLFLAVVCSLWGYGMASRNGLINSLTQNAGP